MTKKTSSWQIWTIFGWLSFVIALSAWWLIFGVRVESTLVSVVETPIRPPSVGEVWNHLLGRTVRM